MFILFKRAASKATKRARSANVRAAKKMLHTLMAPQAKPATRKRAAPKPAKVAASAPKPRPSASAAKPRAGLGETVRSIKAGGMPVSPAVAPARTVVPRGASFRASVYSCEQGKRTYKLYIPASAKAADQAGAPMPLVVMLHGCSQTPDDFAAGTRMNALAEEFGLLVAYPAQPRGANRNRCWNWYKRGDQGRDARRAFPDRRNNPRDPQRTQGRPGARLRRRAVGRWRGGGDRRRGLSRSVRGGGRSFRASGGRGA